MQESIYSSELLKAVDARASNASSRLSAEVYSNIPRPTAGSNLFDELICYTDDDLGIIPPSPPKPNCRPSSTASRSDYHKARRSKKAGAASRPQSRCPKTSSSSPSPIPPQFSRFIQELSNPAQHPGSSKDQLMPITYNLNHSTGSLSTSATPSFRTARSTHNYGHLTGPKSVLLRPISRQNSMLKRQVLGSFTSNLSRQNAIREKEGGKMYRLKVRIKAMLRRARQWRFYRFTVLRKGMVRRKHSQNRKLKISAPQNNPGLGTRGALHVKDLSTELKALAGGAPATMHAPVANEQAPVSNQSGPRTRMADYIRDQQKRCVSDARTKTCNSSVEYPASLQTGSSQLAALDTGNGMSPSDHIATFTEMWGQYLLSVLTQRIKLRMEINAYNNFVQARGSPLVTRDNADILSVTTASHVIENEAKALETVEYATLDEFVDVPDQEFEDTFHNRKSMLGEMLEYNSDEYLTYSSFSEMLGDLTPSLVYLFSERYAMRNKVPRSAVDRAVGLAPESSPIPRLSPMLFNLNGMA